MFQPSQHDVRRFFCQAYARDQIKAPLQPMQALAARWIAEHPEYHPDLTDEAAALALSTRWKPGAPIPSCTCRCT